MDWTRYIVLSRFLVSHRIEALERSAVSRAYYGAFNLSRRWLEANVTPIDNRRAHEQVWETFRAADRASESTSGKWQLVGDLGNSLRRLRNQVDYDDAVPGLGRRADRAVGSAEQIVGLLAELRVSD